MPGDSGVTCMLVCALPLPLHTRPWAHRAPGIPCALNSERAGIKSKTRGVCAGEIAKVCLAVIARSPLVRRSPPSGEGGCDEAIHLSACSAMDCFACARHDDLNRHRPVTPGDDRVCRAAPGAAFAPKRKVPPCGGTFLLSLGSGARI